ncbi:sister chromatid cohesion 1 protein 4-like isoform X2 [Phalaenopsis equestris]|uniref:sister chromatid cohesion 1 protein 4-like isoform X2 n=1 Tax=Phalaenopsis equestris TaxID=78828 RepID=UPI0009E38585|nr:sister chromatid cohesion 1 protein 4-like isoform X2 [Phalaenopsis equestris]
MFYSQFILAKKGPLGTIWIAAHLERKLRKNQVADTDIGVSVDSILFPDAPIALRLSSHLLLGVVRIYSKKVNYLFNDCSEALIKIKHAFRSTAVDLPPEESTAPYNSITLPENFDLDNFELPDSACLDSNFVDHHVSTREQITLQDTVNDTAYPTTKFGLDERFGDEDAPQIGLELDEELFVDKKISPQHNEASMSLKTSGLHVETSVPSTSMGMDVQFGYDEEKGSEIPNELSELLSNNFDKNCFSNVEELRRDPNSSHRHSYTTQTPDLNEVFRLECHTDLSTQIPCTQNAVITPRLVEHAQEQSTPGLLEVAPSNFQEVLASSPQKKAETHVESYKPGSCSSPCMERESAESGKKTVFLSAELGCKAGDTAQGLPMPESLAPTYSNWNLRTDEACLVLGPEYQHSMLTSNEVSNISTANRRLENEKAINTSDNMNVLGGISDVKRTQKQDSNEPSKVANVGRVEDVDSCVTTSVVGSDFLSSSCGSNLHTGVFHSDPSLFLHEVINPTPSPKLAARFETEHVTSNICTDNLDVAGGISHVKKSQKKDCNKPAQIVNHGHVEDGDSCINSSMIGSDFLSRSYGSNLRPIFFHGDPVSSSREAVNLAPPFKLEAHHEAGTVTSNICNDNMDALGGMPQIRNSNEPSQIANLNRVEDGDSCISTSVGTSLVGSDFISRSHGSNLHSIFLHGSPSGFSLEATKMKPSVKLGGSSGFSYEAINSTPPPNLPGRFEAHPFPSSICTDNMDVAGSISNVKRTQKRDSNEPSQIANIGSVEDGDSCVSTSVVGSDFASKPCGSNLHQSSSLSVAGALGEAAELSLRDRSFSLKTSLREDDLHNFRSSFEVQGEDLRDTNNRVTSMKSQNMSRCTSSDFNYISSKVDESSMGVFSKVTHVNYSNVSPSSEFLGPEKMLASSFVVDIPVFQGLQVTEKGVAESDGSFDRNNSQYSRKRREMDSTATLQSGSSAKLSGIPRSRRNADYISANDDVLASILVGKTAPSLETGSIPSLSKVPSLKRPRTMSRVGMHKRRKVLIDDSMVLHADAIRQQLINTEDIRRMRRKAPCSRPEIWKIYMGAMEDDIFEHSVLTGIAVELNSLYDLKYGMQKDLSSLAKEYTSRVKTSGEMGPYRISEFLNEMSKNEIDERISSLPGVVDKSDVPSSMTAFETLQTLEGGAQCNQHDQLEEPPVQPEVGPFSNEQESMICKVQPDDDIGGKSIIQDHISEINSSISSFKKPADQSINLAESSLHDGGHNSINTPYDASARGDCATLLGVDGNTTVTVILECPIKTKNLCDSTGAIVNEEAKTGNVLDATHAKFSHTFTNIGDTGAVVSVQGQVLPDSDIESQVEKTEWPDVEVGTHYATEGLGDGERLVTDAMGVEVQNVACVPNSVEHAPSTMDTNGSVQDFNVKGGLDADNLPVDMDVDAARDSSDFCSAIDDDYTGFLNEDDDDADYDEAENDDAYPEDAQSLENSGWSARTRGVARYLKNLFDEESGQGRKSIVINRLLSGKTRKEASRMFFETLVLKTRDYVQVEQENPFDYIHITPRIKILKSEF